MSWGLPDPPLVIYLLALPGMLTRDPSLAAAFMGTLDVLAVVLTYCLGTRAFGSGLDSQLGCCTPPAHGLSTSRATCGCLSFPRSPRLPFTQPFRWSRCGEALGPSRSSSPSVSGADPSAGGWCSWCRFC